MKATFGQKTSRFIAALAVAAMTLTAFAAPAGAYDGVTATNMDILGLR